MRLIKYLPPFIRELDAFKAVSEALQPEFDYAAQVVRGTADDFFIPTLSEYGAARWERILKITPSPGDTLEKRRQSIKIRLLDRLPYTYRMMLDYLSTVSDWSEAELDAAAYRLLIRAQLTGQEQAGELREVLAGMAPCNVTVFLQAVLPKQCDSAGLTVASGGIMTIRHIHSPV